MIVETTTKKLSPIEIGIDDIVKKTQMLSKCIRNIKENPDANSNELSSLLNGIIDSAVNGGTSKYCQVKILKDEKMNLNQSFLSEKYEQENPDEKSLEFIEQMKKSLAEQTNQVRDGLVLHSKKMDPAIIGLGLKVSKVYAVFHLLALLITISTSLLTY